MKQTKIIQKEVEEVIKITCDVCKKSYDTNKDTSDDFLEIQEFHHINFIGGYASVFGDGDKIECDICQNCLKKMIDGYYRVVDSGRFFDVVAPK
jgi:ribosomal protein S17E